MISATRSFGPLAGIGQSSHQLGFFIRDTISNQSGGVAPLYVLNNGPGISLNLPDIDPGIGVGMNAPSYRKNGNNADRSDSELNYSFNVQRQITHTSSIEVGWIATLARDVTSNFLADNQVPYRSLPASMNPFTTAGRTVLSSQVTSATAIAAGAVVPWTCGAGSSSECETFTQVWGTGSTVTQANRPYPQYGTIDTGNGGGDRIGHSTYHVGIAKFNRLGALVPIHPAQPGERSRRRGRRYARAPAVRSRAASRAPPRSPDETRHWPTAAIWSRSPSLRN